MALLTSYWGLDGMIIFISLIIGAYIFMTRNFKYWSKRGVTQLHPVPFIGNFAECLFLKKSPGEYLTNLYEKGKGLKYLGFYVFDKPALLLRDPALIKNVLIKNFDYFYDRFAASSKNDTLGGANLFLLKEPHWRILRNKLSPFFSSAKMKKMFQLIISVGNDLDTHLESLDLHGDGKTIEVKELFARYGTDVIASCAYGLQVNSLNNPEAEFRKYGKKMFEFTYKRSVEFTSLFFAPMIVQLLGFTFFSPIVTKYLRKTLWGTLNARMISGERRNDLIDTLVDLKKSQTENNALNDPRAFKFDGDNLVAQAAVFFTAGYETSGTAISLSLYELALQPDIQTRLRNEINLALQENEGEISYEMVMKLPYLDMVVKETLRKYPPLPFLDRIAARDYQVPGTDLVIEKGTPVYIPMYGLHFDPQYFPDPEKYDPERFTEDNKRDRPNCVYMPFGEGPHNCIGLRFGLMQSKFGLLKVLAKYEVQPCASTQIPLRLDPKALILASDSGLYLSFRKITTASC